MVQLALLMSLYVGTCVSITRVFGRAVQGAWFRSMSGNGREFESHSTQPFVSSVHVLRYLSQEAARLDRHVHDLLAGGAVLHVPAKPSRLPSTSEVKFLLPDPLV